MRAAIMIWSQYWSGMVKSAIKRATRRLGFDIRHYHPTTSESAQLLAMLRYHDINLVLDVGANVGQFGRSLRDAGYTGRIVSFEPLRAAYDVLCAVARRDRMWSVAPRAAIGAENGEIEINVAMNSVSSSALGMLDAHRNAAPESQYIGVEKVSLRQFDAMAQDYVQRDSGIFIKIDTQGYEDRVLKGGVRTLARAKGLQIELSLVPLYSGQLLFFELTRLLVDQGFELWGTVPTFVDGKSGRMLQVDAIFFRG